MRSLRRIGLAMVIALGIFLAVMDIYLDKHPEVLQRFMAEHPAIFPMSPWWLYEAIAAAFIALVLLFRSLFSQKKPSNRHEDTSR